jgi:hypothetical protein
MPTDDATLRQAADATTMALKRYLAEPQPANEDAFLTTVKHYFNSGVCVRLHPGPIVEVRRKLNA